MKFKRIWKLKLWSQCIYDLAQKATILIKQQ